MSGSDPLKTVEAVDDAFSRGDVEAVLSFYEDGAAVVIRPGTTVEGHAALRRAFEALFSSFREPPTVKQFNTQVIAVGELALFISRWSMSGTSVDGTPVNRAGDASSVLRKQRDGSWKLVIDNPWGVAVLG